MTASTQAPLAAPAPSPAVPRATRIQERIVLDDIRWQTYEMLLADLGNRRGVHLTFDRGRLQIMSPLPEHENYNVQLGQFVRVLAVESQLPFKCLGSMTIHREDLARGLEPDNCFYLANWPRIRGRRDLDFRRDPPPDLALEIDITHSSLDRLSIYAALGVPEVWRFDGARLLAYYRNAQGTYTEGATSQIFPFLSLADVVPFLLQVFETDEITLTQSFQTWLRTEVLPRWQGSSNGPEQP